MFEPWADVAVRQRPGSVDAVTDARPYGPTDTEDGRVSLGDGIIHYRDCTVLWGIWSELAMSVGHNNVGFHRTTDAVSCFNCVGRR